MLQSKTKRDEMLVNIKIDLVKEIHPGDDQTIQIFNTIFKRYYLNIKKDLIIKRTK